MDLFSKLSFYYNFPENISKAAVQMFCKKSVLGNFAKFTPVPESLSGGNFIVKCGHTCTDLGIPIAGKVEEKEELKNFLKWGKW